MRRFFCHLTIIATVVFLPLWAAALTPTASDSPQFMVAAANPHAVAAGIEILEAGGSAVDAAVAVQAVLGLVEPQSSGLGGGGFLLVFERAANELTFLDGRETAPAGATADMFVRDGEVMKFDEAWQSGLSVGVPGIVALYESAHGAFGRLAWAELFEPAIRLASEGFMVITGASSGIMKAGNEGAGADKSFGVNILLPFEQSPNEYIVDDPKLMTFKYFFTRKLLFVMESCAIVLYPGGYGTHDEGFETLTLVQTGKASPRPILTRPP